ncbi:MAG: InlB B-repeat-containing protein [bacterium]
MKNFIKTVLQFSVLVSFAGCLTVTDTSTGTGTGTGTASNNNVEKTYTVNYDGNGNTSGTSPVDTKNYQEGATVTVKGAANLTHSGFTFTGWNTAADGSGTSYLAGDTFEIASADITLYAKWTSNPTYKVSYYGNGNSAGNGIRHQ